MTPAQPAQVAQAKKCVMRSLSFLQEQRSQWFSLSEADATAITPYTRVILPLDFSSFGKGGAFIAGKRLQLLNTEEYAANIRKDSDGGGLLCAEISGDPTHGHVSMVKDTVAMVDYYRYALDVWPRQAAEWVLHCIYLSAVKDITTDIVVRVPVKLQDVLSDLCRAHWRKMSGNAKEAAEFLALAHAALDDIDETPGDQMVLKAKSGTPYESAGR